LLQKSLLKVLHLLQLFFKKIEYKKRKRKHASNEKLLKIFFKKIIFSEKRENKIEVILNKDILKVAD